MYSNFVFPDQFLFELSCKNTHTHKHGNTHNTYIHRDYNEYPIVAFSKNATIIICVYALNENKQTELYLPSTFRPSDIEPLSPKIEILIYISPSVTIFINCVYTC